MMRIIFLFVAAILFAGVAQAASTINSLPAVTFPLPDPGNPSTSTENLWISNGSGASADFRITPTQLGYIFQGAVAPVSPFAQQFWWDTSTLSAPKLKIYTGSAWVLSGTIDKTLGLWIPAGGSALDARDYGVVADGVTSDDVAMAAALAACSSDNGRTLNLPQGKILLSGAASILAKNCNVVGQGVTNGDTLDRGTTFVLTSTTIQPFVLGSNFAIQGVNFWWPSQVGNTVYPPLFIDDGVNGINEVTISDVVVINAYDIIKQTSPAVGFSALHITTSSLYAVHRAFDISQTPERWRITSVNFTLRPWLLLCGGACSAQINLAVQTNEIFRISGDGASNVRLSGANLSAHGWRYGFIIGSNGAMVDSDITLAFNGVGTYLDTSPGGSTTSVVFRGFGNRSFLPSYAGFVLTRSGNDIAFNLGANGTVNINGFNQPEGRGTFIKTVGANVFVANSSARYGSAADGVFYYCLNIQGGTNVEVVNNTCDGAAVALTYGIFSPLPITSELRIQNNTFKDMEYMAAVDTTGNPSTIISGNYSKGTLGASSIIITGTGEVVYGQNQWDKPPDAAVSVCGAAASVTGSTSGMIQVGTTTPNTLCTLTLPWIPYGGTGNCIFQPSVAVSTGSSFVPAKSWALSFGGNVSGAQIFFNCPGRQ